MSQTPIARPKEKILSLLAKSDTVPPDEEMKVRKKRKEEKKKDAKLKKPMKITTKKKGNKLRETTTTPKKSHGKQGGSKKNAKLKENGKKTALLVKYFENMENSEKNFKKGEIEQRRLNNLPLNPRDGAYASVDYNSTSSDRSVTSQWESGDDFGRELDLGLTNGNRERLLGETAGPMGLEEGFLEQIGGPIGGEKHATTFGGLLGLEIL
jgi:hypothetical protein